MTVFLFVLFMQKTADDMRISDWSSDVCSSDLPPAHHRTLLVNCFAQAAALMQGRNNDEDPARAYPGNRPSTTLLLDDVTPEILGALIAFYEQRTFVNAVLMGINPFDQFGVELGKDIARSIEKNGPQDFDPSTMALIKLALD